MVSSLYSQLCTFSTVEFGLLLVCAERLLLIWGQCCTEFKSEYRCIFHNIGCDHVLYTMMYQQLGFNVVKYSCTTRMTQQLTLIVLDSICVINVKWLKFGIGILIVMCLFAFQGILLIYE